MFGENMKKILKKINVFGEHAKKTPRKSIVHLKYKENARKL